MVKEYLVQNLLLIAASKISKILKKVPKYWKYAHCVLDNFILSDELHLEMF